MTDHLRADATVGIIGLGYVGLPLATAFAEAGLRVIGHDVSTERVAHIAAGHSSIEDVPSAELAELVRKGMFSASTEASSLARCGSVSICVPRPLGQHREPDLDSVIAATETALANLARGALVVEHADIVVDLRNAVRQRLSGGASGRVPANVDVL